MTEKDLAKNRAEKPRSAVKPGPADPGLTRNSPALYFNSDAWCYYTLLISSLRLC